MTAAELLLLATEDEEEIEAYSDDTQYCEIDNDLRTIKIPADVQVLGVENDKEVKRVWFKMPRYFGEFDLSEFKTRVNFENAKGEPGGYAVDDATAGTEYIVFSWLADEKATAYKGETTFAVRLRKYNEDKSIAKEFNTTKAKMKVLEGMDNDIELDENDTEIDEDPTADLEKLAMPVIRLESDDEENTTAVIGEAVLGYAILGTGEDTESGEDSSEDELEQLVAPIIYLESEE